MCSYDCIVYTVVKYTNISSLSLNVIAVVVVVAVLLCLPCRYTYTLIVIDIEQFVLFMFMTELCARNADLTLLIKSNKKRQTSFAPLIWKSA